MKRDESEISTEKTICYQSAQEMKRNNAVEIVRIFAAVTIVFLHLMQFFSDYSKSLSHFLSIYVELFFILSGFFMMIHITTPRKKDESTFTFLYSKVKVFWFPLLIADVIQLILNCIMNHVSSFFGVLEKIWHFKWEFLLLQCAGFNQNPQFNTDYLIGPTWFLSAMMLALAVIYPLAKHYQRAYVCIIAPLSIVFIYSNFVQTYGTMDVGNGFSLKIMDAPLRAFAGISVGVLAYEVYLFLQTKITLGKFGLKKIHIFIDTCCWLMLPVSIMIAVWGNVDNSLFMVLVFVEIVVSSVVGITPVPRMLNRIPNGIASFLGKFSLFIYLSQWSAIFATMIWMSSQKSGMKMGMAALFTLVYAVTLYGVNAISYKAK